MTLFDSRSQHLTILSSAAEKRYGCRPETPSPRTVEMCPVIDSFSSPDARSQIYQKDSVAARAPLDALSQTHLDYTIPCPGRKPFVTWFYCDTPHPSKMPGDDSNKFPWSMIRWLDGFRLLMQCQSFSEACASGQRANCKVVCIRYAIQRRAV
jgi:hypothetical protein